MKQLTNIAISVFVSGLALFGGVAPLAAHTLPMRQAELCAEAADIIREGALLLMSASRTLQNRRTISDEDAYDLAITFTEIVEVEGRLFASLPTIDILVPRDIQEQWLQYPATEATQYWFIHARTALVLGREYIARSVEDRQVFGDIPQSAEELVRISATMVWNCGLLLREADQ